jgi:hypothetical protein
MPPEPAPCKPAPPEPARRVFADPAPTLRAPPNPAHRPTSDPLPATGHRLGAERPSDARHPTIRKQSTNTTSILESNTYPSPALLTRSATETRNLSRIIFISCPQPMPPQKKIKRFSATNRTRTPYASPSAPGLCSPEKSQPDARPDAGFPIRYPLSAVRDEPSAVRSPHPATIRKQSINTTSTAESNTYASKALLTRSATRTRNPSRIKLISRQHPPSPKKENATFQPKSDPGKAKHLHPVPCNL